MGSKLAKSPSDNTNSLNNEKQSSQANASQQPQSAAHPHANLSTANIPAGCPMHQEKADQQNNNNQNTNEQTKNLVKTASGSGCPIGNNNDINPNNMVRID